MASAQNTKKLSSLTQWSKEHIRAIFESPSDEQSTQAVDETFSSDMKAIANGRQVGLPEIKQLVLSIRAESPRGLRVEWKQSVEEAFNLNNRVFFFWFEPFFQSSDRQLATFIYRTDHSEAFISFITSIEPSREMPTSQLDLRGTKQ